MAAGVHVPLRFLRAAMRKGITALKGRISATQQTIKALEPVYAKLPRGSSNLHPTLRQKVGNRFYSTKNVFRFTNNTIQRIPGGSHVRATIGRSTAFSPFSSTLRPNLTGGAFPRTACGYSIGGGARFFSHTPAAPAQIMQQVSNAMRAFLYSGGEKMDRYYCFNNTKGRIGVRAQLAASLAQQNAPGAYIDFDLSPTLTCVSPLSSTNNSLENPDFLTSLSADFGAMMGTYVALNADIKRLSTLGDLLVTLVGGDVLRVHFPGCDREFVERLCDEVGVLRGVVHEDEHFMFGTMATDVGWKDMLGYSHSPPSSSTYSEDGFDNLESSAGNDTYDICSRITGSESATESLHSDNYSQSDGSIDEYAGLEGIHRFLEECDEYRYALSPWQ